MAGIPQYTQITGLLAYMRAALRADPELLRFAGSADEIVLATAEHPPFSETEEKGKKLILFETEFPALCLFEKENPQRQVYEGQRGEKVMLTMLYLDRYGLGTEDIHPEAWARRASKSIRWQAQHWLAEGRITLPGGSINLGADAHIDRLEWIEASSFAEGGLAGFEAELEMYHDQPPWTPIVAQALLTETIALHPGAVSPNNVGPIVTATIKNQG